MKAWRILVAVAIMGLLGCSGGGDSGPTGSTTDFSGVWSVTFDGSDSFSIQVTQQPDGSVDGFDTGIPNYSSVTGQTTGSAVEFTLETLPDSTAFNIYKCSVTLEGGTFSGTCTYVSMWSTKQDRPVEGERS